MSTVTLGILFAVYDVFEVILYTGFFKGVDNPSPHALIGPHRGGSLLIARSSCERCCLHETAHSSRHDISRV